MALELPDFLVEIGVFLPDVLKLGLEATEAWEAIRGEHEGGRTNPSERKDEDGQAPFEEKAEPRHAGRVPRKEVVSQEGGGHFGVGRLLFANLGSTALGIR